MAIVCTHAKEKALSFDPESVPDLCLLIGEKIKTAIHEEPAPPNKQTVPEFLAQYDYRQKEEQLSYLVEKGELRTSKEFQKSIEK